MKKGYIRLHLCLSDGEEDAWGETYKEVAGYLGDVVFAETAQDLFGVLMKTIKVIERLDHERKE